MKSLIINRPSVLRSRLAAAALLMVYATMAAGCAVDVLEPEPPVEPEWASLNVTAAPVEEQADDPMGANVDCTGSPDDLYAEPSAGTTDEQMAELDGEAVSGAVSAMDASEEASIIALLGKNCSATCTVVNYGTGFCPVTIGGDGHTTFLGGCGKACRKAKGDAASKLPPGCVINNCSFSGC